MDFKNTTLIETENHYFSKINPCQSHQELLAVTSIVQCGVI